MKTNTKTITFSESLKHFREKHGISQVRLGRKLGVTGNYISQIESGHKIISENSSLRILFSAISESETNRLNGVVSIQEKMQALFARSELSIKDISTRSGITEELLDEISNGATEPSYEQLCILAKSTPGFDLNDMLSVSNPPYPPINTRPTFPPTLSWSDLSLKDDIAQLKSTQPASELDSKPNPDECFSVLIKGDAMEPEIKEGDQVTVNDARPCIGDIVIARMKSGDLVCRSFRSRSFHSNSVPNVHLVAADPKYPPLDIPVSEISWILPIRQVLRRY